MRARRAGCLLCARLYTHSPQPRFEMLISSVNISWCHSQESDFRFDVSSNVSRNMLLKHHTILHFRYPSVQQSVSSDHKLSSLADKSVIPVSSAGLNCRDKCFLGRHCTGCSSWARLCFDAASVETPAELVACDPARQGTV